MATKKTTSPRFAKGGRAAFRRTVVIPTGERRTETYQSGTIVEVYSIDRAIVRIRNAEGAIRSIPARDLRPLPATGPKPLDPDAPEYRAWRRSLGLPETFAELQEAAEADAARRERIPYREEEVVDFDSDSFLPGW